MHSTQESSTARSMLPNRGALYSTVFVVFAVLGWCVAGALSPEPPIHDPAAVQHVLGPIDATIWGHVRDAAGAPLHGITIEAWPAMPDVVPAAAATPTLVDRRRQIAEDWRVRYRTTTVTDEHGDFELSGLLAADYHVTIPEHASLRFADRGSVAPGTWLEFAVLPEDGQMIDVEVITDGRSPQVDDPMTIQIEPAGRLHATLLDLQQRTSGQISNTLRVAGTLRFVFKARSVRVPMLRGARVWAQHGNTRSEPAFWNGDRGRLQLKVTSPSFIALSVEYAAGFDPVELSAPGTLTERPPSITWIGLLPIDANAPQLSNKQFLQAAHFVYYRAAGSSYELNHALPAGRCRLAIQLKNQIVRASGNRSVPQGGYSHPGGVPREPPTLITDVELLHGCTPLHLRVDADGCTLRSTP